MHRGYLKTAAFLGALAVVLGAMAAHKLKNIISDQKIIDGFETGVRYQFYHVFALALSAIIFNFYPNKLIKASGILFIAGIILFSGSLYLYTYKEVNNINGLNWVVYATPVGGVAFIIGWLCLSLGVKYKDYE
jgi:uncharacterized membrane protein YgdD (TMEM256/DUF423 family)